MSPMTRHLAVGLIAAALVLGAGATSAVAGKVDQTPPPHPAPDHPATTLTSLVRYDYSRKSAAGAHMRSADADWSPPRCWYEPRFGPQEFKDYLISHWRPGSAFTRWADEYRADDYHVGDEGAWYALLYSDAEWDTFAAQCASREPFVFVGPAHPAPPGTPLVGAGTLAGLAYDATTLPEPPVTLRPAGANRLVNFATEVAFGSALERVWVTARYDSAAWGIHVAATTVAVPSWLRVESGTENAEPQACTYKLTPEGGGYGVDTGGAPCNVTYRRGSPAAGYTLRASIVWKVAWTASASPDGPPENEPALPDGESTREMPVTVRENQTVVR